MTQTGKASGETGRSAATRRSAAARRSGPSPARMVEVGAKDVTAREAVAECRITMTPEACARLVEGTPKGDPLEAAKVAGLLAAKRTPDLLPFCHPITLTGAEMESLTAAAVAALSLYDTAKAFDRGAEIGGLRLVAKSGGKSGDYRRT